MYPPQRAGEDPALTSIDGSEFEGGAPPVTPSYLDIIASEARSNPVTDTTRVTPTIGIGHPEFNAQTLL
jgi:hypothetical protein